ncbi:MAG: preprotein translocase subunit SecA [Bacteroidetes bacterium]|nr:preprotein translocase subunit SecA [Bacteroidota bacterium]
MIAKIIAGVSKVLGGNKADKDLKEMAPIVDAINQRFAELQSLSHDELRGQTQELIQRINAYLTQIDEEITEARARLDSTPETETDARDGIFHQLDELEKARDKKLEEVLAEILPDAFAVVKDAARRFSENAYLEVSATDLDRTLAVSKPNVKIQGDKAVYANEWSAAGGHIRWNMVHYDVQLIGGIALHRGKIAEMATGEGKTLVSTLPAYLNALGKRGVHIVTVNDYLARRDCEWNGPLFNFLGLTVDCLEYHQPNSEDRRKAYLADITYGTNNEFGFDYLRDNMAHTPEEQVQRKHHFAMVDEVDSVLIDDARTPLIISGPTPQGDDQQFVFLKPRIQKLVEAQKKYVNTALNDAKKLLAEGNTGHKEGEGGLALLRAHRGMPKNKAVIKLLGESGNRSILTKVENHYLQDQQKEMPKADEPLYFTIEEKTNSVDLTERGIELITGAGEDPHFFVLPDVGSVMADIERTAATEEEKLQRKDELMRDFAIKSERIHSVQQLLKAYTMFERDVEYIVQDNKVKIVDEQTGRVLDGRRYSDGLHQAIEAKENVNVEAATQTYATITLQNYFRMYHKLCGMTGTAETEAQELWDIYKLGVMVIPTNKPAVRKDLEDLVYKTKREKYNAAIDEIVKLSSEGRPTLVGTTSVEVSELLSRMLKLRGIKHNVLNAKQHQREAEIVAEAGKPGAVTIATNMAGRGTDIKIGDEVKAAGGLAIIGTERHDSRRVDRQLRGRAGRQGDPGTSRFFVSLEDDLMRIFGSEKVSKFMDRFGYKEGDVIEHSWMSKTIERNQKRMEQNNFGIRKRLLEYDDVMNKQRTNIYTTRRNALYGDRLSIDLRNMLFNWCSETVARCKDTNSYEELELEVLRTLAAPLPFNADTFAKTNEDKLADALFDELQARYTDKCEKMAQQAMPVFRQIRTEQGDKIENVVVPFTDGIHSFQLMVNMEKALQTDCREMIHELEKNTTLQVIDDEWKEHLRELDELKQSTGNAQYEQKDPLLIYKIESFEMFGQMLNRLHTRVLGLLFRSGIDTGDSVEEARKPAPRKENNRVKAGREDISGGPVMAGGMERPPMPEELERIPQAPIRSEVKVGRNDPCPCGSGKKFKNCHGQEG